METTEEKLILHRIDSNTSYQKHKIAICARRKLKYDLDKDKANTYAREYYELNKGKLRLRQNELSKKHYEKDGNKIKRRKATKDWCERNKDKVTDKGREYYKLNKTRINKRTAEWQSKRLKDNPILKIKENIRSLVKNSIKNHGFRKNSKTSIILGCSIKEFIQHIESKWEPWMSWDNYGNPKDGIYELNKTWDFDHKIPSCTTFTLEEIIANNHYTNIQPLCSYTNRWIKSGKLIQN